MRLMLATLSLLSCVTLADAGGPVAPRITRGNLLKVPDYRTSGLPVVTTYFVDPTGDDTTACAGPGTAACATIQGALNKVPRRLRNQVTVNVAAGTYGGFVVSGFVSDEAVQQTNSGLLIDGALVNSTLATGSATGTATGGSAGNNQTFGTLVDLGAAWTTNDLVGRLLTTTNPTNTGVVIESNTSTTITVVNSASYTWAVPTSSTTYQIQDPSVFINTTVASPPLIFGGSGGSAAITTWDNTGRIAFRNMRTTQPSGTAMMLNGSASYYLRQMQVRSVNGAGIVTNTLVPSMPQLLMTNTDVFLSASVGGNGIFWAPPSLLMIRTSLVRGTTAGTRAGISTNAAIDFQGSEISGFTNGIVLLGMSGYQVPNMIADRIYCGTYAASAAIAVGNYGVTQPFQNNTGINSQVSATYLDHIDLAVCDTGLLLIGYCSAELHGFTGSVGGTVVSASSGSYVGINAPNLTPASITFGDGGTGQYAVNLDNGAVTASAFSDFTSGLCIANLGQGSRACGR